MAEHFFKQHQLKQNNQRVLYKYFTRRNPQMKPACRYGVNCRKFANGQCNFYHPKYQQSNGSFGNQQMQRLNHQDNYQEYFKSRNQNYMSPHERKSVYGNQNGKATSRQHEDVLRQLCRDYHYGLDCRFGGVQTCKKKHNFIITEEQKLKRIYFKRIINDSPAKLTKFSSSNQSYQVLRIGNEIKIYRYNHQDNQFKEIYHYTFPVIKNKYLFYDHKNQYIYFSCENEQTGCTDIGYYNLEEKKHYYIANSHLGKVTGMAHYNENVMLSTCTNGQLKIWTRKDEEFIINTEMTNKLQNSYNPNNIKLELLFLDLHLVNQIQIFTVGTNDGRLFFFFGEDLSFNEIAFDANLYTNVYKIKYTTQNQIPYAVVLTWNVTKTFSALLSINLTNSQVKLLVQAENASEQISEIITVYQFAEEYLLVGNYAGKISIYRFSDTKRKIGGILHQNPLGDIVYTCDEITTTGLRLKTIFILQKKCQERQGSLGIYRLK